MMTNTTDRLALANAAARSDTSFLVMGAFCVLILVGFWAMTVTEVATWLL